MEFKVVCPEDGRVEVSLEDISTVILRDPEVVDVVFDCPRCGTPITVSLKLPNLLMSALESLEQAAESGRGFASFVVMSSETADDAMLEPESCAVAVSEETLRGPAPGHIDDYVEYFRRQLADVACVDDALGQMD